MKTLTKCLISLQFVGCMACATEQTPKPSEFNINNPPMKDAAQTFRTMIYEQEALGALYLHPHAYKTHVLKTRPCRITASTFRGAKEQPQDMSRFYTVDVQYDANDRIVASRRISDRSVTTHRFEYDEDRLIKHQRVTVKRGRLADSESITTETKALKHDASGRLFTLTVTKNGIKQHRHIFAYEKNQVKIATHSATKKAITNSTLNFDGRMRPVLWHKNRYTYRPDRLSVGSKLIDHDITLKDGTIQRIITTSEIQGEKEPTTPVKTVYHMRYDDNKLKRIINHFHPKSKTTLYTVRDFEYMCQ